MAAIIAQITRAKRERDKKKTYQTEKCMWVMPHLYLLAIPPAHYFAWLWRLSSCPPKRKEKRCCKILSQVRPPTLWLPLWPCSAQQILGKVKKQHKISTFSWANKVGQTLFDPPHGTLEEKWNFWSGGSGWRLGRRRDERLRLYTGEQVVQSQIKFFYWPPNWGKNAKAHLKRQPSLWEKRMSDELIGHNGTIDQKKDAKNIFT